MRMIVHLELEVKIQGDRTNANEIFPAAEEALREAQGQVVQKVVEACQEGVVSTLCRSNGRKAKKGLGGHEVKGDRNRRCRHRRLASRAGHRRYRLRPAAAEPSGRAAETPVVLLSRFI